MMPTNGPQEPLGKEKKSTQANTRCGRRYYPIDNAPDKESGNASKSATSVDHKSIPYLPRGPNGALPEPPIPHPGKDHIFFLISMFRRYQYAMDVLSHTTAMSHMLLFQLIKTK